MFWCAEVLSTNQKPLHKSFPACSSTPGFLCIIRVPQFTRVHLFFFRHATMSGDQPEVLKVVILKTALSLTSFNTCRIQVFSLINVTYNFCVVRLLPLLLNVAGGPLLLRLLLGHIASGLLLGQVARFLKAHSYVLQQVQKQLCMLRLRLLGDCILGGWRGSCLCCC